MKKITQYCTYWPTNIGNAFIDLGSIQSLKAAALDSSIYSVSGFPRILFEDRFRSISNKILEMAIRSPLTKFSKLLGPYITTRVEREILKKGTYTKKNKSLENCFNLGRFMKSDFAIFSGVILDDFFIKLFNSTIFDLKKKNVKIIFNSAGGSAYSKNEVSIVRKFLKKIRPYGLISRDETAFKNYQDLAEHSYDGIDCAFFINDYFTPPKLELPEYVILNFDKQPEPKLNISNKLIIRTHHRTSSCMSTRKIPRSHFTKPNTLISDLPDDYLVLYSNTAATFSDRVHACVATLSFGQPARLFFRTKRALLFNKVGVNTIDNRLTYPSTVKIEKEKEKQVNFLSDLLSDA